MQSAAEQKPGHATTAGKMLLVKHTSKQMATNYVCHLIGQFPVGVS